MRRLLVIALAFGLVVAACGDDTVTPTSTPTTVVDAAGLRDDLDDLVAAAEAVRGLQFFDLPTITVVSSAELADRVKAQIDEELDPEEMAVLQSLYELLGLLDGSVDLVQAYRDLYAEQVGGFYDDDTGELVVAGDEALTPLARSIVVHELVHALADEHFGFAGYLGDLIDAGRYEEASAIQALAEGDATYFQLVYLQGLSSDDQADAIQESLQTETTVLDSLPEWFGKDLTFPYDSGFGFVSRVVRDQGVAGVDQAYTQLPDSTEQILHPEKFFSMEPPLEVVVPEVAIGGYEDFEEGVFGEWNLGLYLLSGADPGEAVTASAGWGGDHYRIYTNGEQIVFLYVFMGDTPRDATELADSLVGSVSATMPVGVAITSSQGVTTFGAGAAYAYVAASDRTVVFVAASDPSAGSSLVDQLRGLGVTP